MIIKPTVKIKMPIHRYSFFINAIKALIESMSLSATGLYKQNVMADPMPNSDTLKIERIDVNKLLSPK